MKDNCKKIVTSALIAVFAFVMVSCGAKFNTVGNTIGNMVNGGEVTSQGDAIYFIKDGDIYKTDGSLDDAKCIKEGDYSFINVVGGEIYYYDNEISTICKANSTANKEVRITELYCDTFTVSKDNIYASILTGAGGEDLEAADNYSVVRLKVTDKKLASVTPKVLIKKARMIGCIGDSIYVLKKKDDTTFLYRYDNEGNNGKKLFAVPNGADVIANESSIYLLGTVDSTYGLYEYSLDGKKAELLKSVTKNPSVENNAFNICGDDIYYENYSQDSDGAVKDVIYKMDKKTLEVTEVMTRDKAAEYNLAEANGKMLIKVRDADDITTHPEWQEIKTK